MPFFSLIAVVGLTYYRYESVLVEIVSRNQGLAVLPVILLGCLLLLRAILALSDYERLQSESRLSALRELYYDSLQREQNQVRHFAPRYEKPHGSAAGACWNGARRPRPQNMPVSF